MDGHIVSGGAHQAGEPETAVMNGVKDGALRRQRVIQAVDIHAHPHFRDAANQRHGAPSFAVVVVAATSGVDAPAYPSWSFNGSRPRKSSGAMSRTVKMLECTICPTWRSLGGGPNVRSVAAASFDPARLDVCAVNTDGSMQHKVAESDNWWASWNWFTKGNWPT